MNLHNVQIKFYMIILNKIKIPAAFRNCCLLVAGTFVSKRFCGLGLEPTVCMFVITCFFIHIIG